MPDWQDFLAALGGFGAGASQGIAQVGQRNRQMEFQQGQQERGFGQQEGMQRRLFQQQHDLETMREAARNTAAAARGTVPITGLPDVFRREFQTPPPESALMQHAIEEPGRPGTQPIPRPQVREPERIDERVLGPLGTILGRREDAARAESDPMRTLTLMLLGKQLESQPAGGGLAPGTDITVGGGKNIPRLTQRGPLREPVAVGPESRFLQSHTQHFMSAEGGTLSRIQAEQQARALWNDERYKSQWLTQYGGTQGRYAAELGQPVPSGVRPQGGAGPPVAAPGGGMSPAQALTLEKGTGTQRAAREEGPLPPSEATAIAQLRSLQRQLANVETNYRPAFVGKGFQGETGGLTGRFKQVLGMVPPEQVVFYKALKDASDMLLRARSGAQINEQEYKRLAALLPAPTDEPTVFEAGFARFKDEIEGLMEDRARLATMPRKAAGNLPRRAPVTGKPAPGAATPARPPAGGPVPGSRRYNPATKRLE